MYEAMGHGRQWVVRVIILCARHAGTHHTNGTLDASAVVSWKERVLICETWFLSNLNCKLSGGTRLWEGGGVKRVVWGCNFKKKDLTGYDICDINDIGG